MDANLLTSIAAILLSLGFSYIPKLDVWYAAKDTTTKRLIMVVLILVVAAGSFGISCANLPWVNITCDAAGIWGLVQAFVLAMVANQSTFLLSPITKRVEEAKTKEI